ncbi:Inositol 1,4,5-trisphosphate receptor-interacting protein [Merluccius polli]|uniref:Inositol 1,4,5-trisphosphate receptor-interacting protein n=1 Tax=Merluccius polli TaxID=89951 RepID=A0AA47M143_MERPO|nr:Inositol 1,4,5-trisphosphate receptor-interacting protein [Merluccius polli]
MSGAVARVCMVVAAAILNHPLLFPQENATLAEQDAALVTRMRAHEELMRAHEERLAAEQSRLEEEEEEERSRLASRPRRSDEAYSWYFWSAVSLVVFLAVEVSRVDLADAETWAKEDEDACPGTGSVGSGAPVLHKGLLSQFCDRCLYTLAHEDRRVREFVEGFADDLLESMRIVCRAEAHMEPGDFLGVGSMFEAWTVHKPLTCDLIVPFAPPAPYAFQYRLWCGPASPVPPDLQGFAAIEVTEKNRGGGGGCACDSAVVGEDVLCLLHGDAAAAAAGSEEAERGADDLLCAGGTSSLSKDRVMRWFQISVSKAWGRISHKYDFELAFRRLDAAGALKVRFRSGKVLAVNLIPAVRLDDTDAYFVSHFPSDPGSPPDAYWPLSLAVYEQNLLKHFARTLPENACHLHCLQILTFLHKKQTALSGESALTDYHLKTVLLHLLLLSRRPASWGGGFLEQRLRDALAFLQRSLREKRLPHVLVGNGRLPRDLGVPEVFRAAEPINLFRPLVLQRALHADAVRHAEEMLRNAPALIQEYTPRLVNGVVRPNIR